MSRGYCDTRPTGLDQLGNWSSFTSGGTPKTRIHNAANELTVVNGGPFNGQTHFGNAGNLDHVGDQGGDNYVYDPWNRLVRTAYGKFIRVGRPE